jgi:hypothetical protein
MADNEEQPEINQVERVRCTRCKVYHNPAQFNRKRNGDLVKQCIRCRDVAKQYTRNKCEHNRVKSTCKECGGSSICEHKLVKSQCKKCGGSQVCIHSRQKSQCKNCGGGSICEHKRVRSKCKDCGGSQVCIHSRQKSTCKDCDPAGHLRCVVSGRIQSALKSNKNGSSIEYLGCTIDELKEHIEKQFTDGMTWDNRGNGPNAWHINRICPIKYAENGVAPTLEDVIERLHWKNTKPMWATENISKGNRFIGK